ncbi:hypothetical protein K440DRAFT_631891 [Wilcoxina mikolae CBS 423.85]|nr:hypothetical protein K440DRAFT_631891 [Wilcoxina mikolae CBS 423.85]
MDTLAIVTSLPDANRHWSFCADDKGITSLTIPPLNPGEIDSGDFPFWDDFVSFEVGNSEELHTEENSFLETRRSPAGDVTGEILGTYVRMPEEKHSAHQHFERAQLDTEESLLKMEAYSPTNDPPHIITASELLFSDSSNSPQPTIDPIDLEMELFFGFDCSPPPESPRSTRSKSSPLIGDVLNEEHICPEKSCKQSFRRANALQRHIASIHQRPGETCPFCPQGKRAFNRSDNFQRHVSTRHASVPADDKRLRVCLKRLYQGNGRRTSWKK